MKKYSDFKLFTAAVGIALISGCKIIIPVSIGGKVVTASGGFLCSGQQTCEVDVTDTSFSETFIAQPDIGYRFVRWKKRDRGFCGGDSVPCKLYTSGFAGNPGLINLLSSNEVFYLQPVFQRVKQQLAPGQFTSTVHYSYDSVPPRQALEACPIQFTSAFLEVTENGVYGIADQANGIRTNFNTYLDTGVETRLVDPQGPDLFATLGGQSEYLRLDLRWEGSSCRTSLHFDRKDGEIIPPTATFFFDGWCFASGQYGAGGQDGGVCGSKSSLGGLDPKEYPDAVDVVGPRGFTFSLEDKDGWIAEAKLKWSQQGGGSGVIDLLAESSDLKHHKTDYGWGKKGYETNPDGFFYDYWVGFGRETDLPLVEYAGPGYEHYQTNSNNFTELFGAGVLRNINHVDRASNRTNGSHGILYGDMKFELTVIDNDDKSYRRVWEILTPDGSQSPSGGYHILISLEESIFGERCAEIVAPADAIEAENRREGTYIFVGQCPQIFRTNLACFYEGFGQSYTSQTIYLPNDFPNPENICKGTIIRS